MNSPVPEGRWLIAGAGGRLGREVHTQLTAQGTECVPLGRDRLDVTDARAVDETLRHWRPDIVVNCAAWTDVDAAESHEEEARRVNADGARHLARSCAAQGARLLHVSTDYVFPGALADFGTPYSEDTPTAPGTAYGRTKRAGERAVLRELPDAATVVRTAWLYGRDLDGFVGAMARAARCDGTVDVVRDQYGQPSNAVDVAARLIALADLPARAVSGVFHATNAGSASRYELAREVFRLRGADPDRVRPTDGSRMQRPARRPYWSVLGHRRWTEAGLSAPRDWRTALAEACGPGRQEEAA
ncbi:dTDP-4-dehydrorhamnose reductase [Streptomyces griseus]|uniref:dTDP-4-dehydrorhamnose reductase n=1 Tax=Streptomyces griseus TaxID=1911 RepID=UPI0005607D40|nr:dTDP-4-dehydrorhamnose reductase [Streptomyces griseus]